MVASASPLKPPTHCNFIICSISIQGWDIDQKMKTKPSNNNPNKKQKLFEDADFNRLMHIARNNSEAQLEKNSVFRPFFLFITASHTGGVICDENGAADSFEQAIRLLAIAQNVKMGVFVELLQNVKFKMPEKIPVSPDILTKDYVLVTWQSRPSAMTFAFPVHRKPNGKFLRFGGHLESQNLPWRANIVPQQDPTPDECLAATIALKQFNLSANMSPPV